MFPGEAAALAAASPVFTDERIMKRFIRYFLKWTALFLLGSILAFLLVRMMPVSPVEQALTRDRLPQTAENIAYMEHRMGLDQPLPSQYFSWLLRFVSGNWGESLVSGADIKAQFIRKMPYSFSIGILGLLLASVAAFGIGYRAAVRGQGFCDRASAALAVFCVLILLCCVGVFSVEGTRHLAFPLTELSRIVSVGNVSLNHRFDILYMMIYTSVTLITGGILLYCCSISLCGVCHIKSHSCFHFLLLPVIFAVSYFSLSDDSVIRMMASWGKVFFLFLLIPLLYIFTTVKQMRRKAA